jgi:hypothetical protein
MRDASGTTLYVGATVRGERRIEEHRRHKSWFSDVATIDREPCETAKETSVRERELIANLKPRYNGRAVAYGHVPVPFISTGIQGKMTLRALARRMNVSPDGLRVQVHRGALTAIKEGRDWFVTDEEAARYEREQAGKKGTASPRHSRVGNRKPRKPTPAPTPKEEP